MLPRVPTHPSSFRVFYGYKRPGLGENEFLETLGDVFMPGTPMMLRPLGLAGYLPAIPPSDSGVVGMPDEVAIIAYASQERYEHARHRAVIGRMYTPAHLALFDMEASRSQYPSLGLEAGDGITAFYLEDRACDWQADGDVLFWIGSFSDRDAMDYFRGALPHLTGALPSAQVLQCVGQTSSNWASIWVLLDRFLAPSVRPDPLLEALQTALGPAQTHVATVVDRLVLRDSVPSAPAERGKAFSFIFERDLAQFLV